MHRIPKENKLEKFLETAMNKMFEIGGHDFSYKQAVEEEEKISVGLYPPEPEHSWYHRFTWTSSKEEKFRIWFVSEYCRAFKANKHKGKYSGNNMFYKWFNLSYGLRVEDNV